MAALRSRGLSTALSKQELESSTMARSPLLPSHHTQERQVLPMAQGRGSAAQGRLALGFLALCLLLSADIVGAATHNVDWSFGADSWSKGRTFHAGDVLMFNYDSSAHNVVEVDAGGYYGCRGSGRTYNSGKDQVTLGAGTTYFICTASGHCGGGMKMAVTAN